MSRRILHKIILLGDSAVGKTSILHSYVDQKFVNSYKATIGADMMEKQIVIDGKIVNLVLCDTAGQEKFRSMGQAFYRGVDCCVLVYDVTNKKSFQNIQSWIQQFMQKGSPKEPQRFPLILIANKIDKQEQKMVQQQDVDELLRKHPKLTHLKVSAKNKVGIEAAFQKIARSALQYKTQQIFIPVFTKLNSKNIKQDNRSKKCC